MNFQNCIRHACRGRVGHFSAVTPAAAACQRLGLLGQRLRQGRPDQRRQEAARQVHRHLDEGEGHSEVHGRQERREVRAVPQLHRLRRAHLPGERTGVLGRRRRGSGQALATTPARRRLRLPSRLPPRRRKSRAEPAARASAPWLDALEALSRGISCAASPFSAVAACAWPVRGAPVRSPARPWARRNRRRDPAWWPGAPL